MKIQSTWTLVALVIGLLSCIITVQGETKDDEEFTDFLEACSMGETEKIKKILEDYPSWTHRRSIHGETCLHVAGILGQTETTKILLDAGADPNIRTTHESGLRMHPLAWNVYGAHVETARVLLENGAKINLDVDSMTKEGEKETVLDLVLDVLKSAESRVQETGEADEYVDKYTAMKELLLEFGAKRYVDLTDSEL